MSSGIAGLGSKLQIGDGADPTEAFTDIAAIVSFSGPSLSKEAIETTALSDTWRTFVSGLKDGGEVTFDLRYIPTEATHGDTSGLLSKLSGTDDATNFKVIFSDSGSTEWSFAAITTGFEPSTDLDSTLDASVTLKVSGQPTLV